MRSVSTATSKFDNRDGNVELHQAYVLSTSANDVVALTCGARR